ncbi:hypothetical protein LSH36_128g05034 [Paralvinella palmiformis]|uniref:AMP-dependent synthetase/ligase domain-containing protein n=1 Tax=Paralvinella palmiformis TaxID=53620 RepID=A0AAD9NB29_9ANNE|nr:hypothetical protein LSH36_128g05034 [Paralvinella palmiformis]
MIEYASITYGGLLGGGIIAGVEIFTVDGTIDEARSDDELLKLGCDGELPGIKVLPEDDVALLVYTSGSTGDRKGASITHRNLVANVLQISSSTVSPYSGNDVNVAARPFTHGYGICMHLTSGLYNGCTSVFLGGYTLESMLKIIEKYKVTILAMSPLNLAHTNNFPAVCNYAVSSVKTVLCAGAPLSCRVLEFFFNVFEMEDVRDAFGMSEVMFVFMPEIHKPHLGVGIPLPNVEFKVPPRELEDVIQDLSGVECVVVVGVPDEDYHELSKAFVVKQPGSSLTEEDVISAVQGNSSKFGSLYI